MFLFAVFRTNLQEMRFDDNRKDVEGGVTERWRDLALESHRPLEGFWSLPSLTECLEKWFLLFCLLFPHLSIRRTSHSGLCEALTMSVKALAQTCRCREQSNGYQREGGQLCDDRWKLDFWWRACCGVRRSRNVMRFTWKLHDVPCQCYFSEEEKDWYDVCHSVSPHKHWDILFYWRRKWQPTPVFLPGELRGQSNLAGCSP